ncbi:hypothetical protein K439DRAFT_1637986 [Ramaria rubella]|nr:hypothetical protein K439DRAFT_1637986 [Ramaria rubella]
MVKLSLSSTKGNGARFFPHAGYLALTPIKLEGVVRTRLDDDRKPVLASDLFVAVRCYEARIGRTGITHSNLLVDFQLPLWSKPPHDAWAEVGDGEWPFRLVLPPKFAGHSTASFQDYRVFWRVEAVLNHIPMTGVGHRQVKTYDLPLMRYDAGEPRVVPEQTGWAHAGLPKHPGSPALRYSLNTPPCPLGPMDLVPVALKLSPIDPACTIHSIALAVERRLEFHNPPLGTRAPADDTSLSSTTNLIDRRPPSPAPKAPTPKVSTSLITSAQATDVPRDEDGVYTRTVTLQIPAQKSTSHWAVGETMRTALVTLRFFLRAKVTLVTPQGASATLDLEERELFLVSSNESQRRLAVSKHAEAVERARVRDASQQSPRPSDGTPPSTAMTSTSLRSGSSGKAKSVRRPHTSAGPRDAARDATRSGSRRAAQGFREARARTTRGPTHTAPSISATEQERDQERRGGASEPEPGMQQPDHVQAWEDELEKIEARSHWRTVVEAPSASGLGGGSLALRSAPAIKSFFASPTSPLQPSFPSPTSSHLLAPPVPVPPPLPAPAESVQAWEEELERIAAQSRRRSVEMLGFTAERRTRPHIEVGGGEPY